MRRPIGYYVHHHGDGHRQRAVAIGHAMKANITLLGTGLTGKTGRIPFVDLPDDQPLDSCMSEPPDPGCLHYAPLDHEGIRQRTAMLAEWIARARPRLMVVDVSVEVAMLARLASVPTVYVRLSGDRSDTPHIAAFRGAIALLAPFHQAFEDDHTQEWIRAKTFYAPAIVNVRRNSMSVADDVLVVIGRGGGVSDGNRWAQAARAVPERRWRVIGHCTRPPSVPSNLEIMGWVENADDLIANAGVVVGAAGDGLVSAVLANRRPFVCIPESRPFDEQLAKARRLNSLGLAAVALDWPESADWSPLIDIAEHTARSRPQALQVSDGPQQVAKWLAGLNVPELIAGGDRL